MKNFYITLKQEKYDVGGPVMEALATLYNCLAAYLVVYPFIKNFGFNPLKDYNQLLPLNRFTASQGNNVFLYIVGCLTTFSVGVFYNVYVLKKWRAKSSWLTIEAVTSLIFLAAVWRFFPARLAVLGFGARVLFSWLMFKILKRKHIKTEYFSFFFYVLSVLVLGWLTKICVIDTLFSSLTIETWVKLIVLSVLFLAAVKYQKKINRNVIFVFDGIVLILLTILVFKMDPSYFDYSPFLGAINDVMCGKDILANVVVSYGFFNMYIVAYVFKFFGVQDCYVGLSIVISVLYVLGYGAIYIFLRRLTQDFFLSAAFLFFILQVDFYCLHIPSHWVPQMTFLRMGAYLPVFFTLSALLKNRGQKMEWLFGFVFVFFFWWLIDYGMYMTVALLGTIVCAQIFLDHLTFKRWIPRLAKIGILFFAVYVILTAYIYSKYGHGPVWSDLFYFQKLFMRSGLAIGKLNAFGPWVMPFLIYWTVIYVCLKYGRGFRYPELWLFLSFFGLESLMYFMSKAGPFDLPKVVLAAIILTAAALSFLISQEIRVHFEKLIMPFKFLIYAAVVLACISANDFINREGKNTSLAAAILNNPKEFVKQSKIPSLVRFLKKEENYKKFARDLEVIDRLIPADEPLSILSKNDTLYYVFAKRQSLFKNAFHPHFETIEQLDGLEEDILKRGGRYLFVDNLSYQCYPNLVTAYVPLVFEDMKEHFTKKARIGFLDLYERRN